MAVAAGTHALGVNWGYHGANELTEAGAPQVLTHFDELASALDGLWPIPVRETIK
jgi:phosphoglycolate phosphatase